jgi:hypothetical protein
MDVLSGQHAAPLSNPGMCAAGDVHRDPGAAMTGPGSPSVAYDGRQAGPQSSDSVPVGHPGQQQSTEPQAADDGGGSWTDMDTAPAPSRWVQL